MATKKETSSRMNPTGRSALAAAIAELAKAVKLLAGAHALPGGAVLNEVTELADHASELAGGEKSDESDTPIDDEPSGRSSPRGE
jgi:hypothetical protein